MLKETILNTLRKAINLITAVAALCLSLCVLPAEAALPSGLQDVYTIFTTGNAPAITNSPYDYCSRTGAAQASWSSPDFNLSFDGGSVGGYPAPGIIVESIASNPTCVPTGAFLTYANSSPGFDTNLHWMKVAANNTTLGSFRLTHLEYMGYGDTVDVNIIGTKVGGGTVQTGTVRYVSDWQNITPTSITLTNFAGVQITAFEIDFTPVNTGAGGRPADFTFQSFTVSNAKAPSTVTGIAPTNGPTAGGTSVTITGTNFTGATVVKFGSTNAASFSVDTSTQITATSPAGSGMVDVTVDGSATSASDQFTYVTPPTVTTQAVSSITSTTATGNGNITNLGVPNPTAYGVVWNTTGTPTTSDSKVDNGAASTTGAFTAAMTSLSANTTYHVRAYATNSVGTSYGTEVTFTSSAIAPTVTTQAVSSITSTTATGNGNITSLGAPNPTQYGVVWNTTGTPTTADAKTTQGAASATGTFTSSITGLSANTTYYVRAYATNTAGTSYGSEVTFTSSPVAPTVTTQAASTIAATSATGNGNITATNGANATVRGVIYYAYTNTDKVIGDGGVTDVSEAGSFGTGAFTEPLSPLAVNTQYNARAYATSPYGTGYGARVALWTLANVPSAPTVNSPTVTTLNVTVNVNGNPASTEFSIQETSTGNYMQADGTLGAGAVWQTAATWGTKTVTGLTTGSTYTFQVKARNGGSTETAFGATTSGVPVAAPTVTSQAVSALAATSATGNGNITATNGANATARGVIYYLYTNTDLVIGDSGVTNVSEGGSFTTGAFTESLSPLAVNTQYNARAYATSPNGTGYGARVAFWTLANVPSAPTVNTPTATTLNVTLNVNGNPASTEFCIQETGTGNYLQAGGTLGAGQVWQNLATWGTKTVTGLTTGSTYTFQVKARNGGSTETAYGATASGIAVAAPAITSASSTTFTVGALGAFTVTTTGTPTPALSRSGALPGGVSFTDNGNGTASLGGTPGAGTGGAYPISITASNGNLPNATQSFTLTANESPSVTTQPVGLTSCASGTISFTAAAGGYPAPTVLWQLDSGSGFANISDGGVYSGAMTPTLSITGATAGMNGYRYQAVFTNSVNSATTNPATLTVLSATSITVSNTNDSGAGSLRRAIADICPGGTIAFGVTGTISLTSGALAIAKDLTLTGPGAASLSLNGGGSDRIFQVTGATSFTLQNLTLANGAAIGGGALVDNAAANTSISGCVFNANNALGGGGAILSSGTLGISDSVFSGNSAIGLFGGAIFASGGNVSISNTLFSGNSAPAGGAIANGGLMTLSNVTLNGNTATTAGGAVYAANGTTLNLLNASIGGNSAAGDGGGIAAASGAVVNLKNSLVANNTAALSGADIFGIVVSQGYNLIGSATGATIGGDPTGNLTGTSAAPVNPLLGALANNGGPTQTLALLFGSPAIDSGTCGGAPAADQRGMARPQNGLCDIGAYERGVPASVTVTSGTPQSTPINTAFATALSAKVADALGTALDGVSIAFAGPGSGAGMAAGGSRSTDGSGIASFSASANGTAGAYGVTATVNAHTASFSLSNSLGTQAALTLTSLSGTFGTPLTLVTSGGSGTGALSYSVSDGTAVACVITSGALSASTAGTCLVTASKAADSNYNAASTGAVTVTMARASQSISFGAAPSLNYVGASGNVSASGGASGLPVTFTSATPGVCSISGASVTRLAAGTCSIAASQAGNGNYLPATATQDIGMVVSTSYTGPSATGSGSVTASFTGGGASCGFAVSRFIALASVATPPPAGIAFPHGLFDFSTSGCTPGSTLAFTISYPLTLPSDTQYWKFGPTPGNATPHWYALPATISGASVRFNITDGGVGDDDLSINGSIVDQGGPGASDAAGVTGIPTLSEWGMLMLTGLLALFGLRQMRRRAGRH